MGDAGVSILEENPINTAEVEQRSNLETLLLPHIKREGLRRRVAEIFIDTGLADGIDFSDRSALENDLLAKYRKETLKSISGRKGAERKMMADTSMRMSHDRVFCLPGVLKRRITDPVIYECVGNIIVRAQRIEQMRESSAAANSQKQRYTLAELMEGNLVDGSPVVFYVSADKAGSLNFEIEKEQQRVAEILTLISNPVVANRIYASANEKSIREPLFTQAMRCLRKKFGHAQRTQANGGYYISNYSEYNTIIYTPQDQLQKADAVVNKLMNDIMSQVQTVVIDDDFFDLVTPSGQGISLRIGGADTDSRLDYLVKVLTGDLNKTRFVGFMDSASYCHPRKGMFYGA